MYKSDKSDECTVEHTKASRTLARTIVIIVIPPVGGSLCDVMLTI